MKIVLTGGGTGGHFYPLIAVAEALHEVQKETKLVDLQIYYLADQPYNEGLLFDNGIIFKKISAGKMRRYFSLLNVFDFFKTIWGVFGTFFTMYSIYPDVVFSKGGYVSYPVLFAARFLRIPVIIHESDTVPGRTNAWAASFAERIAVSYPEAVTAAAFAKYKAKVAYTGQPVRKEIMLPLDRGADEFLQLEPNVPVILILGGSQGSSLINEVILDALPRLIENYQIIHQTGKRNIDYVRRTSEVVLRPSRHKTRYRAFEYLNDLAMRMSAGAADLVISRAGSTIFELALWGKPSIIIPIGDSQGDHQRQNAFSYARAGACEVIEESNLSPNILESEIHRLTSLPEQLKKMSASAHSFSRLDAAHTIATELVRIGIAHEQ